MGGKSYLSTIIIASFIAFISILSLIHFWGKALSKDSDESLPKIEKANTPPATAFLSDLETQEKLEIHTRKGIIKINNVYKKSISELSNSGVAFADNNNYYMAFYPQDESFIVVIQNEDVFSARKAAEEDFLKILGISSGDACLLNISLRIPFDISEAYSGEDYGLSFCPNGKNF